MLISSPGFPVWCASEMCGSIPACWRMARPWCHANRPQSSIGVDAFPHIRCGHRCGRTFEWGPLVRPRSSRQCQSRPTCQKHSKSIGSTCFVFSCCLLRPQRCRAPGPWHRLSHLGGGLAADAGWHLPSGCSADLPSPTCRRKAQSAARARASPSFAWGAYHRRGEGSFFVHGVPPIILEPEHAGRRQVRGVSCPPLGQLRSETCHSGCRTWRRSPSCFVRRPRLVQPLRGLRRVLCSWSPPTMSSQAKVGHDRGEIGALAQGVAPQT